nr:MAG TPA: hypothetical protein [Caudoviricetes sp.]
MKDNYLVLHNIINRKSLYNVYILFYSEEVM